MDRCYQQPVQIVAQIKRLQRLVEACEDDAKEDDGEQETWQDFGSNLDEACVLGQGGSKETQHTRK
jgi:hypothetical protein